MILLWIGFAVLAFFAALAMIQVSLIANFCHTQVNVLVTLNETQVKMQAEIAAIQLQLDKLGTLPVQRRAGTN